jgi:hypothetical protein
MFEASFKKGCPGNIGVSRYRQVDIERASGLFGMQLNGDTADQGVRNSLALENPYYKPKRFLFGISVREAHGFAPKVIEGKPPCQAVVRISWRWSPHYLASLASFLLPNTSSDCGRKHGERGAAEQRQGVFQRPKNRSTRV